ncbi:pimeloyl-ACP methyl ester carboxylesterase [Kribbella aluminosa]|uniref:Pimeloyl-ACP methyl ester carboxylesterase n=1 Tax=Kribbella aluminosa TaxID=416017 RepID=A0ABS4UN24_9ACTN|nr:alpha/beta fold hydrolase [Kribbella aluminosa]MBP2353052.1 pimeloyl-ACP methyl ester carboxylesterase [Kribbella aluminosa]
MPPSKSATTSSDGTRIAVYTYANPGAPVLVCVHGYPDNAALWEPVAELLAEDFEVVTYDVRGAGESDHPISTSAYSLDRLQEDFQAVLDQAGREVHVLAHDWGSIQAWHFVTDPDLQDRIASFTSISGPSLDHAGYFLRQGNRAVLKQLLHSWYIFYLHLPWLPELAWRKGWAQRAVNLLDKQDPDHHRALGDYVNGMKLYRANVVRHLLRPAERRTDVPVLAVSPDADLYVTTPLQTSVARWASNLTVKVVRGGHWMPRNDPGLVAELVREHTRQVARWET